VLICDDQALVRAGFRAILGTKPGIEVVGEAENGEEAVALAERRRPDVILMDIRMPVLDGVEATRRLVASGSPARILVLTTFDLDEYVHAAIRAGASGFLLKDVTPAKLVEAIRIVAGGDALLAPSVTRRLLEQFLQRVSTAAGAGAGDPAWLWEWLENHPRLRRAEVQQLRAWYAAACSDRSVPFTRLHNLIVHTERQLAQ